MGACFDRRVYDGNLTRAQVEDKFDTDRSNSQHNDGHSYSGAIGMLVGPVVFKSETFPTIDAADEWLGDNHNKKWGPAWAVKVEGEDPKWVVGGICSS